MVNRIVKLEELNKDLIKKPYEAIMKWGESRVKVVGSRIFRYLALMPHSLFLPAIPFEDTFISPGISMLLLTPSGGCKTNVSNILEEISLKPYRMEEITPAEIQSDLNGRSNVTMITGDAGRILKDFKLVKVIEGLIGDSRISKKTKREYIDYKININCYMAGVPQDLTTIISSGLISRLVPLTIFTDKEQQDKIGEGILKSVIKKSQTRISINEIKDYYIFLTQIQEGINREIKPIKGYAFKEYQLKTIHKEWVRIRNIVGLSPNINWYRELWNCLKYAVALAFLNIFNRKIVDDHLTLDKEDLINAIILMREEMTTKYKILNSGNMAKKLKNVEYLEEASRNGEYSKEQYEMVKAIIEGDNRRE